MADRIAHACIVTALLLVLGGCEGAPSTPDAGEPPSDDASHPRTDSGPMGVDAAIRDAGSTTDGGVSVDDGGVRPPVDVVPRGLREVHIAPDGDDAADCSSGAPCRTFARATSVMRSGDELVVRNGSYPLSVHGALSLFTPNGDPIPLSGAIPSGSADQPTVVRAETPGGVSIEGGLMLGVRASKVQHVFVYGLTFHGGGRIYNGDHNTIKACGFEGGLGVGTIDHAQGNTYNLVEDVWVWGRNVRGTAVNYRAHHNTWRRVVVRSDGCDEDYCGEGAGNYAVGITVYNSHDTTLENVLVLDRILGRNPYGYSDFATAQHDSAQPPQPEGELLGRNQWLGCMSINSEDTALVFEADAVETGTTATLVDFVALATAGGVYLDPAHRPYEGNSVFFVRDVAAHPHGGSSSSFSVGCDVVQAGDPGCAHDIMGVVAGAYTPGLATALPTLRYGTSEPLWPWPHEELLEADLCASETRGLCAFSGTLTEYVHSF